jgi:hypothetical protein
MNATKTARLIARNGIFDQTDEEYMVLDANGIQELDDWTPAFSIASEAYEWLTGDDIDSAECQVVETNSGEEEFTDFDAVCGDASEGIAVLDGKAYEFFGRGMGRRGVASRRSVGAEWTSPDGSLWRVEPNGDDTRWVEIEADDE